MTERNVSDAIEKTIEEELKAMIGLVEADEWSQAYSQWIASCPLCLTYTSCYDCILYDLRPCFKQGWHRTVLWKLSYGDESVIGDLLGLITEFQALQEAA